jgi:hypothetical protein
MSQGGVQAVASAVRRSTDGEAELTRICTLCVRIRLADGWRQPFLPYTLHVPPNNGRTLQFPALKRLQEPIRRRDHE